MDKKEVVDKLDVPEQEKSRPKKDKQLVRRKVALSRVKRRILRHTWLCRLGILAGILIGFLLLFALIIFLVSKTRFGYYIDLATDFLFLPEDKIEIINDRTNILILGKGGGGHEAPDLTDTIIFASIDHVGRSVSLVSIPRDIWIPSIRAKVNSAYYWGNQKMPPDSNGLILRGGGGLALAKSAVEEIIGKPVHYGVVIDFAGFKEVVDVLGGIEVDVETSFIDEKYPIPGKEDDECLPAQAGDGGPEYKCRYGTIEFEKGKQEMDGETALKFVRSRNAEGDEGTDIARSARQQKVIAAIEEKVMDREVLYSPKKLMELKTVAEKYAETDIDTSVMVILARRLWEAKDNVDSHVLPEELLENPPKSYRYDYLYVFIPKADPSAGSGQSWDEVHEWVEGVLSYSNTHRE